MRPLGFLLTLTLLVLGMLVQTSAAGTWRERLAESRDSGDRAGPVALPAGAEVLRDIAYGPDPAQKLDVYRPAKIAHAPVIFMVHGGAWTFGDKANRGVVENKVGHWLPKGFIFISIGYRMLPTQDALAQADDVARALAFAQAHARDWGGDAARFIVMGHSAGAHLAALLAAAPARAYGFGAKPWLGTISLDSAAIDVPKLMRQRHLPFYDRAFGSDPARWRQASPIDMLGAGAMPVLAVCSQQRGDKSCGPASDFVARVRSLGLRSQLLEEDLSHGQINQQLGTPGAYTAAVDAFIDGLLSASPGAANP